MSYRLIDANALNGVISNDDYEKVLNVPCVFADLPNGLNGDFYDLSVYPKIVENLEQPTVDVLDKIRAEIEECKQYRGMTENPVIDKHNVGLDKYYDLGLEKAIKIIDKYRAGSEE